MGENLSQCLPLFLTSHGESEAGSSKQYFYNLLQNRYQTMSIPILAKKAILGSFYGWLVLLNPNDGDCCLWNPTLNQTIQIPPLENPHRYQRCLFSKPPTDPACFIVFSSNSITWPHLVYRIGDNTFFMFSSKEQGYRVIAMMSFGGMIYGIAQLSNNIHFEFVTIHMAGDRLEKTAMYLNKGQLSSDVVIPWNWCHLIESPHDDELFLVTKISSNHYLPGRVRFRVHRIDVSTMEVEEVHNIDGRTIFISKYGNGLCRSSESSIKPNSIYYTNDNGKVIYIYDLDDRGTITLLPYPDVDINPNTAVNFWVDLPDILNYSGVV